MSKKLYYSSCSIATPHIGVIIDDILNAKQDDNEVYWLYCHCALSTCFMNLEGYNCICNLCHLMYREYQKVYGAGVHVLPIRKADLQKKLVDFYIKETNDLKHFTYRNVEVGNSILSLYYTVTRDLDMNHFKEFCAWAQPLINELCNLVDYAYKIVDEIKPDEIIIHNGRLFEDRFFYDIARATGTAFRAVETVGGHGEPYAKMSYPNALPHNIEKWNQLAVDTWNQSNETEEEKVKVGSSFFERRRKGELVADVRVYIADQRKGLLPKEFNPNQRNIAIFTSSQDEIVALGDDWSYDQLFPNQHEAIGYILHHSTPDIHYYIRIHPNLKGILYKDHTDLYQYDKLPNATVISPESQVSSYDLMDACEKVITFGSSVGLEACYWGKPSILLGHTGYELSGAAYHIKQLENLMPAIEGDLPPKPKEAAIKFAYFVLDRKYKVDKTKIDINIKTVKRLRWVFSYASYLKIRNSSSLYQIAYYWFYCVLPKFTKPKFYFPWK
jgi:hypothetical protein